jgi:hypothetical protein
VPRCGGALSVPDLVRASHRDERMEMPERRSKEKTIEALLARSRGHDRGGRSRVRRTHNPDAFPDDRRHGVAGSVFSATTCTSTRRSVHGLHSIRCLSGSGPSTVEARR